MIPKILVVPGSIRPGSFNAKLAAAAALELAWQGADVTRISLADYPLPIMDQEADAGRGIPDNAMQLARMIAAQDGIFIASPEINASIPALLKNAIDWVGRIRSDRGRPLEPWRGKAIGLGSASGSRAGGTCALWHLRAVVMAVGAEAISDQCVVTGAADAFGMDGSLVDEDARKTLTSACRSLIRLARALGPAER